MWNDCPVCRSALQISNDSVYFFLHCRKNTLIHYEIGCHKESGLIAYETVTFGKYCLSRFVYSSHLDDGGWILFGNGIGTRIPNINIFKLNESKIEKLLVLL